MYLYNDDNNDNDRTPGKNAQMTAIFQSKTPKSVQKLSKTVKAQHKKQSKSHPTAISPAPPAGRFFLSFLVQMHEKRGNFCIFRWNLIQKRKLPTAAHAHRPHPRLHQFPPSFLSQNARKKGAVSDVLLV
jgi:hypothetical protein